MSDLFSGLANLTKQVTSNISTYEVRKITDKIQGYVMNYTEAENLVREATNEDPWGPTGPQMKEISNLTFQYDGFHQVTEMLWKRMFEDNKYAWRRVYKSLTLLNYLLQHGSERVLANSRDHVFQLRSLEHYKHVDEKGKDQGVNIRHRVGIILELLNDDDKLRAERKKAKADNKERYQGYTSNDIKMGRGGGYNGNSASSFSSNTGSSKRYDDFDADWKSEKKDDYSSKEVNAFQFPEDARQSSNSPELGFRQDEAEDDGFGSFAAARSHTTPSPNPTSGFADFSSPAAKTTHVPFLAPPSTTVKHVPAPSASFDLLGLDSALSQTSPSVPSDPFGNASSSQSVDFFSAAPVTVNPASARPPRPPSGGGLIDNAPAHTSPGFNVDWNSAPGTTTSPSSDPFCDFAASTLTPVKSAAPNTDNLCDLDFGGFSAPATAFTQTSSSLDFFGSIPAAARAQPQSSTLEDLFSNNMMLTSSAPVPAAQQISPTPSSNENKPQAKIGNTWAGASGLFDLDNLAGKSGPAKPSLSLNQMQQQKQGGTNGNIW